MKKMKKSIFVIKILFSLLLAGIISLPIFISTAFADTISTTICATNLDSAKTTSGYSNCSITTTTALECTAPNVAYYCSQDTSIQTDEYIEGLTPELDAISKTPPKYKGTVIKPEIEFLAPIPGIEYGSIKNYLGSIYNWGIGIVGVLALIQLIRGGLMYMVSGAVEQKTSAKGIITDALIGLIIALASVVIVTVLNPRLAIMTEPALKTPAIEEELPPPTGEKVAKCMTSAELQNLIDNNYACELVTYFDSCLSDQGGYECLKPTQ